MHVRHTFHTLSDLERYFSPRLVRRLKSLLCVYRWGESQTVMCAVCVASVFVSEVLGGNRCLASNFDNMLHGYAAEAIVMDNQPLRYGDDDVRVVSFLWDVICLMLEEYEPEREMPQWAYDEVGTHAYLAYEPEVMGDVEPMPSISTKPTIPTAPTTQTRLATMTTQTQQTLSTHEGKTFTISTITTTTITGTNMTGEEMKEVMEAVQATIPAQQVHIYKGNIGQKIDHIDKIEKQVISGGAAKAPSTEEEADMELFRYIHPSVTDDDERLQVHKEVCNLVRHNTAQDICAYLDIMWHEKRVLLPISGSNALVELRRLGMPGEEVAGYSSTTFYKYYRKS